MDEYKKMYLTLFNKVTDVIEDLKEVQRLSEEMYISKEDPPVSMSHNEIHE
ncbi:MAG: hypothetical protein ABF904_14445 [Ethanoligenens sp.]